MSRLIPYPLLSAFLVVMWMVMTRFSVGQFLLGIMIAILAGWAMASLQPEKPRLRGWRVVPKLIWTVFIDIVRSNIAVTRLIMNEGLGSSRRSAFIEVPLSLRSPSGLAVLAIIVTATPGTAWLEYASETESVILHVFDAAEADFYVAAIRDTYEPMLMEIFE